MSSRGSITWPPPRTEMPSASRGSGAVHDALDSIDLRLDLHDLVRDACAPKGGILQVGGEAPVGGVVGGQNSDAFNTTRTPDTQARWPHSHGRRHGRHNRMVTPTTTFFPLLRNPPTTLSDSTSEEPRMAQKIAATNTSSACVCVVALGPPNAHAHGPRKR